MKSIDHDALLAVLREAKAPCVSLYQPTHRHHPANQQDALRFRNQVDAVEASLRRSYGVRTVRPLVEAFRKLEQDGPFWEHALDGLAVLACPGTFAVFAVQRPLPERAVVADSYHTKPLLRVLQSADRYQVLCLSRHEVRLLEGNRDALDEADLDPSVPQRPADVAEAAQRGRAARPAPEVDQARAKARTRSTAGRRGRGTPQDVLDLALEKHFRAVGRAITARHSKPSGLPLVVAALPEHQAVFREVTKNPLLLPDGIAGDPFPLDLAALRHAAWEVVAPAYLARLSGLVAAFREAQAKHRGSADAATIADAAVAGKVATLLVEADRAVPGRIDAATGRITFEDLADPDVDDLLDDLAELVLARGGEVVVVPHDAMPTRSGLAAVLRR